MKKVFAIIAIMVVLVGAVFADAPAAQTSRITIRSEVQRQDPTFALKGGISSNALSVVGNASTTDYEGAELKQTEMTDWDIAQANITAYFGIFQTSAARNQFTYTFELTVTQFVQYEGPNGGAPTTPYTVNKAVNIGTVTNYSFFANNANVAGTTSITAPSVTDGTGTVEIDTLSGSVTFTGTDVVNSSAATDNVLLSAFPITWTYDREAPAGKYEADILLTVSAS